MTLRNGEVRWEVGYYDADRGSARRRRRFQRREDAQTFLDEMRRRRRLGELAEAEWARRTVRHLALDWWALYVLPNLSARTRRDYRKLLDRHIIPRLGSHRLCDVTVPVVDDFKAKLLAAGVGDSQTRQALAVLSGMFTYAERRDRVAKNPLRLVKKPFGRRKRAVVCLPPLSVELARALLLQKERYGAAALVCMLAYAGPRPQDALALEWWHVRERTLLFERKNVDGEIVAGQKTGRPARTTPLWALLRDDLLAMGAALGPPVWPRVPPTTRASRGARPTGGTGPSACGGRCAKRLRSASRRTGCDTRTRRCGSGRARRSPSWRRSSATVHR
ncbi:MAG TPA: hypothetical protein VI122_05900 [Thermoleophilaceae bacterium]